jgi:uncharacterized protein (TIGR03086 family)
MSSQDDVLDHLSRALDQTEAIVSRIRPDQTALPTPCSPWDVKALVDHVVRDIQRFTVRASRGAWESHEEGVTGEDWTGSYREAARSLLEAWRREGALDGSVALPFGEVQARWLVGQAIADVVVHGWDLAKATGQPTDLDPELGRFALEWGQTYLKPEFRGDAFGAEVPVSGDAPVIDRLVGFFGRDPAEW